jgi:predicted ATPase
MLKSLHLKNFTVFPDANLEFGRHINVIIGENGLGKTHLLKAAYAGIAASAATHGLEQWSHGDDLRMDIKSKLSGVFRAESVLNLIHRSESDAGCDDKKTLSLKYRFEDGALDFGFTLRAIASASMNGERLRGVNPALEAQHSYPTKHIETMPVFLPARELLTIYPGFISLYETTHLPFEETWRDTAVLLGAPLAKGVREMRIAELLEPIERTMGGRLILEESGRFYLDTPKVGRIEMHLLAEGFRKLGMIARLIATGALLDNGYLFWDEPEANLNPKIIKSIARTILQISGTGIQVFIATHSLFLLRELHILQKREFKELDTRCFGLHLAPGGAVGVEQGATMDDVGSITVLDEDLQQSERYIDTEIGVSARGTSGNSKKG